MKLLWSAVALAAFYPAPSLRAEDAPKPGPKAIQVPYRLTAPKHVLVRAKINGKGPFNFLLDTGAPALFVTTKVAEKLGVKPDRDHWGTFTRFEIEGGVVVPNAKARIEDLFQLEGMNGLGLAGAELHGVIGYNVLARYRIEFDFTRDKLTWTPLDFEPEAPKGLGGRGGQPAGLEAMGGLMKALGGAMGRKAKPDILLRGFLGLELADADEIVNVKAVTTGGPAGAAGVKPGDKIKKFQGRNVLNVEDVERLARRLKAGDEVRLTIERDGQPRLLSFKMAEGL